MRAESNKVGTEQAQGSPALVVSWWGPEFTWMPSPRSQRSFHHNQKPGYPPPRVTTGFWGLPLLPAPPTLLGRMNERVCASTTPRSPPRSTRTTPRCWLIAVTYRRSVPAPGGVSGSPAPPPPYPLSLSPLPARVIVVEVVWESHVLLPGLSNGGSPSSLPSSAPQLTCFLCCVFPGGGDSVVQRCRGGR